MRYLTVLVAVLRLSLVEVPQEHRKAAEHDYCCVI
jgi:hypothetical protein